MREVWTNAWQKKIAFTGIWTVILLTYMVAVFILSLNRTIPGKLGLTWMTWYFICGVVTKFYMPQVVQTIFVVTTQFAIYVRMLLLKYLLHPVSFKNVWNHFVLNLFWRLITNIGQAYNFIHFIHEHVTYVGKTNFVLNRDITFISEVELL